MKNFFHLGSAERHDGADAPFDPIAALREQGIALPEPVEPPRPIVEDQPTPAVVEEVGEKAYAVETVVELEKDIMDAHTFGHDFRVHTRDVEPFLLNMVAPPERTGAGWLTWPLDRPGFVTFEAEPAITTTRLADVAITGVNPKDLIGATKPDLSLVPPAAMLHIASAMMDGAVKYGPYNWRGNPVKARVYVAAAMRHFQQFLDGEDIDPISKVHHLGHAGACVAILLDARETGNLADDRPTPGAAGDMIRRWDQDKKFG